MKKDKWNGLLELLCLTRMEYSLTFSPLLLHYMLNRPNYLHWGIPTNHFSFRRLHRGDWNRHDYWWHRRLLTTASLLARLEFWVIPASILLRRSLTIAPLGVAFVDDLTLGVAFVDDWVPWRGVSWRMSQLTWWSLMMVPCTGSRLLLCFRAKDFSKVNISDLINE